MAHLMRATGSARKADLGVHIGLAVDRFLQTARRHAVQIGAEDSAVLRDLLAAAADADNRLAAQARRIALLETLSLTDELTGLLNRRGFERDMLRLLANARRHDEGGVIVVIDLDDFKSINDVYGHAAGDTVLASFGRALSGMVRETDLVGRVGGDEFAIALARSDTAGALGRVGHIESLLNNVVVLYAGHRIPVRCSLGVASFDRSDELGALMQRADAAMYMRKRQRQAGVVPPRAIAAGG